MNDYERSEFLTAILQRMNVSFQTGVDEDGLSPHELIRDALVYAGCDMTLDLEDEYIMNIMASFRTWQKERT